MSNFHLTCEMPSVHVDEGRILRCRVAREDGDFVDAQVDLNGCIGNDNGTPDEHREPPTFPRPDG